jgi:zinc transporter ZupT
MVLNTNTIIVGSVPAICMLLFTIIGLKMKVSDNISGALQHFAAGLLLSAIGSELLPTLLNAKGFKENVYATIGFFLGMGVLIILGALLPEAHSHGSDNDNNDNDNKNNDYEHEHDNDHEHEHEDDNRGYIRRSSTASLRALVPLKLLGGGNNNSESALSLRQAAKAISDNYNNNCEKIEQARHNNSHGGNSGTSGEEQPLIISSSSSKQKEEAAAAELIVEKALPMSFLAAIIVDSFMDGFLIGITGAAGQSATIIMAGSLSVEMSFVGLTLATACHGMPYQKSIPAALAGPIVLIIGSLLGDILANQVVDNPSMMAGIIGFGTSALLFMVAEELLLEAHEDGEHIWWVDVQLYTGKEYFLSFVLCLCLVFFIHSSIRFVRFVLFVSFRFVSFRFVSSCIVFFYTHLYIMYAREPFRYVSVPIKSIKQNKSHALLLYISFSSYVFLPSFLPSYTSSFSHHLYKSIIYCNHLY